MTDPKKHHFFAQFHLKAWAERDGRIPTYQRLGNGAIRLLRLLPNETGFENKLYSLKDVPPEEQQKIEKEFFARHVDHHAALVYQKIVAQEQLTRDDRARWTRYLMAQRARSPDVVRNIKSAVDRGIRELLAAENDRYTAIRDRSPDGIPGEPILDWFDRTHPGYRANKGLEILMNLIQNEEVSQEIFDMHWWVHDFKDSLVPLLASDRPLRISNGIGNSECVISLPLTPSKLFIAAPTLEKKAAFVRMNQLLLVQDHNRVVITFADRSVYGQTGMLFVERHWTRDTQH